MVYEKMGQFLGGCYNLQVNMVGVCYHVLLTRSVCAWHFKKSEWLVILELKLQLRGPPFAGEPLVLFF